ncbi:MAG: hypothetical protein JJT78_06275 [Leptospira sp.]|nr:hypothetical protein [Leptospira sp.]
MNLEKRKLVTIIILDSLERDVLDDLKSLGVSGYTSSPAQGEGLSHIRDSAWEGQNRKIETIVKDDTAFKIMERMSEKYFEKYSAIAYLSDVEVLRKERF